MSKQISAIKIFFSDRISFGLFFSGAIVAMIDMWVWHKYFAQSDLFVYTRIGIYPIRFLWIMFSSNALLAIYANNKEKGVAHLLVGANLFIAIMIAVLEWFYLTNN